MIVGNIGWRHSISRFGREHVLSFWEYVAFLANSTIFLLIGLHVTHQAMLEVALVAIAAIGLTLLARAAAVYPLCAMFSRTTLAVDRRYQHILVWGGLRGAMALALALSLPDDVPERGEIVVIAFAVVAFSIYAQGLTMSPLMRRLRLLLFDGAAPKDKASI